MAFYDETLEKRASKLALSIERQKEKLAKLLRSGRPRRVPDYVLTADNGRPLRLSQAFGRKKDLIVVHNMGPG
jgi:hypothetical protein